MRGIPQLVSDLQGIVDELRAILNFEGKAEPAPAGKTSTEPASGNAPSSAEPPARPEAVLTNDPDAWSGGPEGLEYFKWRREESDTIQEPITIDVKRPINPISGHAGNGAPIVTEADARASIIWLVDYLPDQAMSLFEAQGWVKGEPVTKEIMDATVEQFMKEPGPEGQEMTNFKQAKEKQYKDITNYPPPIDRDQALVRP